MKVRHHIEVRSTCQVNGDADRYDCFVYVEDRVLKCEDVAEAVEQLTREPVYQESLADRLQAKGRHTAGNILTMVVCWPGRAKP